MKLKFIIFMLMVFGVAQLGFCAAPDATSAVAETVTKPETSELMAGINKFVTVMIGVMLSSVAIYVGLAVWNAILKRSRAKTIDYEATLNEPQSVDEAVLLFIQKNKLK